MGGILNEHRSDLIGVVIILAGVLAALAIWWGGVGRTGDLIDDSMALAVGRSRVVIPLLLVAVGVLLVRGGAPEEEGERLARAGLGGTLVLVAITGLFHVFGGLPGINDPIEALGDGGGVVGMVTGGPLHAVADKLGATLILVTIGLCGAVIAVDLSVRELGRLLLALVRPLGAAISRAGGQLFRDLESKDPSATPPVPMAPEAEEAPEPQPEPAPDPVPAAAPKPKKSKAGGKNDEAVPPMPPQVVGDWKLPPMSLLSRTETQSVDRAAVTQRGQMLQDTLDQFGVPTTLLEPIVGPTVTRYVLELGEGVKVSKLESLRKDIAYAMASPDVRLLAPIPGRRAIGVEVPNANRQVVALGDILASPEAGKATHPLEVAIGRDINGRNTLINLATMPHLLIAGATGAGKSSCLNSLLTSILMRTTPEQVRLILIDPKRVEMGQYDRAPHLLTAPVTDPRQAANALAWAVREMERRYDLLHKVGFRDITGFNGAVDAGTIEPGRGEVDENGEPLVYKRLPFILVVVDELADLMMVAARDVEESIARIAQMARAVGIHLVIATQRPSVNVITGVIKANVPARLAFAVSSLTDSRVILDQPGAERLVGKGDLLMLGPSSSAPHRIQGCWVEESEVRAIVAHWKDQAPDFDRDQSVAVGSTPADDGRAGPIPPSGGVTAAPPTMDVITAPPVGGGDDGDELLGQAMELVVETQLGSTSMLQRKLRVGFARAGRIMDLLEEAGVVGPSTGSKAREVLMTPEELAARRGES